MSGSDPTGHSGSPRPSDRPAATTSGAPQPSVWNVANALTMVRIALVPVYGWLLLQHGGTEPTWRWLATLVFVLAMLTDRLDGDLARSRGLVTDFGKVSDPIADKALTGMAFIGLSLIGVIWWWVTIVVLARELLITGIRFAVLRYAVIPASRGGKVKTMLQAIALGVLSAPLPDALVLFGHVVLGVAVLVTVVTGVEYAVQAWRLMRRRQVPPGRASSERPAP